MQDLIKKFGRFIENHVEKIILVIVAGVCAVLFFRNVIFSPNAVTVDKKTFSPASVDRYIKTQADELQRRLNSSTATAAAGRAYKSVRTGRIDPNDPIIADIITHPLPQGFEGLFNSPLAFLQDKPVAARSGSAVAAGGRKYKLPPRIGEVTDAGITFLRAAAWVPLERLTPEKGYDKVQTEANDVDLVTVEGKFDTKELFRQFHAYFAGEEVQRADWRDPCLADPIFAAVQLQRRQLREDGTWGDWQEVPRSRVEPYGQLFKVVERVEDLPPGGMEVRMMNFKRRDVAMDLLQPQAYQIASSEEDWFPPSFYDKFKMQQTKVEAEEKKQEREKNRDQQTRDDGRYRTGAAGQTSGNRTTSPGGRYRSNTQGMGTGQAYGGAGAGGLRGDRSTRGTGGRTPQNDAYNMGYGDEQTRKRGAKTQRRNPEESMLYGDMYMPPGTGPGGKPTTDQVYRDFAQVLVNYRTNLAKLEKPLLFWAFDDSMAPGASYQYRIRLGVFNPVAGTNQLAEQDIGKKNQVILWSEFSQVTNPVLVPKKLYFFAKDSQEAKRSATVEVARYCLGYWRTEDFDVKLGESIGKEMEQKVEKKKLPPLPGGPRITGDPAYAYNMGGGPGGLGPGSPYGPGLGPGPGGYGPGYGPGGSPDNITRPEIIDYRTGKVLVDVVAAGDWGSPPNLKPHPYQDMLYTDNGVNIEHMPVGTTNWPKDLLESYQYVKTESHKEPQPFRNFKKGGIRGRVMPGGLEGYQDMGGMYEDMTYMMEGAGSPYRR